MRAATGGGGPVKCTRIDIAGLKRDRGQFWAEAVACFRMGEEWWLEEKQAQFAERHAQERSESDGGPDDTILQWVFSLPTEKRNEVTTELVARNALLLTTPGQIPRRPPRHWPRLATPGLPTHPAADCRHPDVGLPAAGEHPHRCNAMGAACFLRAPNKSKGWSLLPRGSSPQT
ncbi:VapE domain-containing protein [Pyxidicoccus trucidator]|uniref:VapE domain-containing protein n=1 Tax=Pyxidicoccus trucidator TaxID=2709662 RepID=UPI003B83467A